MKTERGGWQPLRREQLIKELVHDSYKSKRKLAEPTRCPDCGAVYRDGRWRWETAPAGTHEARCPACHRVHDRFPAGYVTLKGEFLGTHRDEILHLVRHREATEKAEHPLERIMAIEDSAGGVQVTTTGTHLAQRIGHALRSAYRGAVSMRYGGGETLLRVSWRR